MFKAKSFNRNQAQGAIDSKAIDRVISATGFITTDADSPRPVFVVGDGSFESKAGYQAFISDLKKQTNSCKIYRHSTRRRRVRPSALTNGPIARCHSRNFLSLSLSHLSLHSAQTHTDTHTLSLSLPEDTDQPTVVIRRGAHSPVRTYKNNPCHPDSSQRATGQALRRMLFKQYRPIVERSATLIASPGTRRHLSTPAATIVALSSPAYRSSVRAAKRVQSSGCHHASAIIQGSYHRAYTTNSTPQRSEQPSGLRIPYYTAEELEAMTVPDLRALLKDNGLKVSGRKANLVDRVLKYVHQHHGAETVASGASRTPAQIGFRSGSGSDSVSASAQSETDNVATAMRTAAEQQQRLKELQEQERQLLEQQAKELKLKEQKEREALQLEQQEKERLIQEQQRRAVQLKEQQEKEARLREQQEKEARLREQQEKEARLREQQEKEARLREQHEKEVRLREQQKKEIRLKEQQVKEQQVKEQQAKDRLEKEQRLKEQQEKEQRLKEQQEKEQRLKEQQEKDRRLKEQQEKDQRLKEQQEKDRRLREQQEQEQKVKQQLDHERVLKEQQEKEHQINAQKDHEPIRKQQPEQQQERAQSNTHSQRADTNESTGSKDEWAKEKIPLRTKAGSAVLGLGIVAWFLAGKRNRRGTLDSEAQEPNARLKEKEGH